MRATYQHDAWADSPRTRPPIAGAPCVVYELGVGLDRPLARNVVAADAVAAAAKVLGLTAEEGRGRVWVLGCPDLRPRWRCWTDDTGSIGTGETAQAAVDAWAAREASREGAAAAWVAWRDAPPPEAATDAPHDVPTRRSE